ncbi:VOC family protein [Bordetella flabilis]|uniref:VOC family protein n=1 Tax=Bordetella flabilis TaxID=463014 RepID=UPI0039EEBDC8
MPPGMPTLTPHLTCANALAAIDFYVQAFGAREEGRMMDPEGKKLMHAMLRIGDSPLMMADEFPGCGMGAGGSEGKAVVLHLYVNDVDAAMERALAAGAKLVMPATDMFWGDRYGQLDDPFGHRWSLATHKFDVKPEEMREAMQRQFQGG